MGNNPVIEVPRDPDNACPSASSVKHSVQQVASKKKKGQCTECSVLREMVNDLKADCAALRERVAVIEDTQNITVGRLAMDLADLKLTVEQLSSELREIKVSHSVPNHGDK